MPQQPSYKIQAQVLAFATQPVYDVQLLLVVLLNLSCLKTRTVTAAAFGVRLGVKKTAASVMFLKFAVAFAVPLPVAVAALLLLVPVQVLKVADVPVLVLLEMPPSGVAAVSAFAVQMSSRYQHQYFY
jgi:hypothetical protein